jgi:hypothetical protein
MLLVISAVDMNNKYSRSCIILRNIACMHELNFPICAVYMENHLNYKIII